MVEGRNKHICSIVGGISKRAGQLKLVIAGSFYTHMQPMVLVYLPTKLDDFVRANAGKYSSTMEHMGVGGISKIFQNHQTLYTVFWYIMDRFGQWVYKQLEVRGDQYIPGFSWYENYDRRERIHMDLSGKQEPTPKKRMVEEICVQITRQAV